MTKTLNSAPVFGEGIHVFEGNAGNNRVPFLVGLTKMLWERNQLFHWFNWLSPILSYWCFTMFCLGAWTHLFPWRSETYLVTQILRTGRSSWHYLLWMLLLKTVPPSWHRVVGRSLRCCTIQDGKRFCLSVILTTEVAPIAGLFFFPSKNVWQQGAELKFLWI